MQEKDEVCISVTQDTVQDNSRDLRTVSEEPINSNSSGKHPHLSLQIPPKPVSCVKFQSGEGSLQAPVLQKSAASSSGSFLRGLSFKKKNNPPEGEKSYLLNTDQQANASSPGVANVANVISNFSWSRCASLPGPSSEPSPSVATPASARTASEQQKKGTANKKVSRSLSVPGRNIVIVRSLSFAANKEQGQSHARDGEITSVSPGGDDDEEIPEEAAICRICFDTCEEGNTLKMECSCKGALQLIHEECAVKWFSMRGNKNCEVCGQEVSNLPVTLLRVSSAAQVNNRRDQSQRATHTRAVSPWQDFVVLVLISSICYFFFLEQLLIQDMKTRAVVIAAPFAVALGLLASALAVTLAIKEYIWTYAAVEFAFVALILCLFYNVLRLNALYSVLLSAILGFSMAMSLNRLYIHVYYWRVQAVEETAIV
ncbi:hypothetical protein RND81_14G142300 [Saponaria officinalis]|uniref:RING-CH-type domain-containing protein n=1 Tax=Saponaria officinalis TaxID=3572 RepID=A0AAW1GSF7_SAPOF